MKYGVEIYRESSLMGSEMSISADLNIWKCRQAPKTNICKILTSRSAAKKDTINPQTMLKNVANHYLCNSSRIWKPQQNGKNFERTVQHNICSQFLKKNLKLMNIVTDRYTSFQYLKKRTTVAQNFSHHLIKVKFKF